eukprot:1193082-Prorocentrum_minimum.AAC.2
MFGSELAAVTPPLPLWLTPIATVPIFASGSGRLATTVKPSLAASKCTDDVGVFVGGAGLALFDASPPIAAAALQLVDVASAMASRSCGLEEAPPIQSSLPVVEVGDDAFRGTTSMCFRRTMM